MVTAGTHTMKEQEVDGVKLLTTGGRTMFHSPLYNLEKALVLADLDWTVQKHPLYAQKEGSNDRILMRDHRATVGVRQDGTEVPLGIVGADYGVVNNREAARMMEPLIQEGKFQIAGAGRTARGKIWVALRNEQKHDITENGDYIRNHMMGIWDHQGSTSLNYMFMGNRLACDNAIARATYDHSRREFVKDKMSFRHTSGIHYTMNSVKEMLTMFDSASEVQFKFLQRLAKVNLTRQQMNEYINHLFPYSTKCETPEQVQRNKEHIDKKRAKVLELHDTGLGLDVAKRGTAWAVYSAVTEYVDHVTSRQGNRDYMDYAVLSGWGKDLREEAILRMRTLAA